MVCITCVGSSPLARGLHVLFVGCLSGSSPLARGLPQAVRRERADRGIIPARAGFTGGACGACRLRWDHPRSRGVYELGLLHEEVKEGSSPLARGLLFFCRFLCVGCRIIPARAGFTRALNPTLIGEGDHPRSRGVYPCPLVAAPAPLGSSPLARGLPLSGRRWGVSVGIIPARAGFTS